MAMVNILIIYSGVNFKQMVLAKPFFSSKTQKTENYTMGLNKSQTVAAIRKMEQDLPVSTHCEIFFLRILMACHLEH